MLFSRIKRKSYVQGSQTRSIYYLVDDEMGGAKGEEEKSTNSCRCLKSYLYLTCACNSNSSWGSDRKRGCFSTTQKEGLRGRGQANRTGYYPRNIFRSYDRYLDILKRTAPSVPKIYTFLGQLNLLIERARNWEDEAKQRQENTSICYSQSNGAPTSSGSPEESQEEA